MTSPAPCNPPSEIRAGDSLSWLRQLPDYPASAGWELGYTLVGSAGAHSFSATASGDAHSVSVPASTTAAWSAGAYTLVEFVTRDPARVTLREIPVRVLPDLAGATTAIDTRTHARRVLDNLNAWLESKADMAGEMQLDGRRIRNYSVEELLQLRDRYAAMVAGEEAGGKGLVRRMVVRL